MTTPLLAPDVAAQTAVAVEVSRAGRPAWARPRPDEPDVVLPYTGGLACEACAAARDRRHLRGLPTSCATHILAAVLVRGARVDVHLCVACAVTRGFGMGGRP